MRFTVLLLMLLISYSASAETVSFAAFTGVNVCANHEGTGGQDVCMVQINHEPNVSFELSDLPSKLDLDHSQYGLKIKTSVYISENVNNTIYKLSLKVESRDSVTLNNLVNPASLNIKDIESLGVLKVTGNKICRNSSCNEWFIPFIYLGPAFVEGL